MSVKLVQVTTVPVTIEYFLRGQIGYMKEKGFEVIAVSSPGDALDRVAARERIEVVAIPMERGVSVRSDLRALVALFRLFRRIEPAIVHASTGKAGPLGIVAAFLAGVPVKVYGLRGLMVDRRAGFAQLKVKILEWVTCLCADRVLAVSRSIADYMIREGLCPAGKIEVPADGSSNGVDAINRFNPGKINPARAGSFRTKYGIPPNGLLIGFVGRLVAGKGIAELAQAWAEISKEHENVSLFVAGSPESQDPVPESVLHALRQDKRVIMADSVSNEEMPLFYSNVDLVVLPTYSEGLPNVLLEAGAMEVPVVATNVTGCLDAVLDGVTGILVPPRDAESLARAIERYLEDSELRALHGRAARARVMERFPPERIWEALHGEYCKLLAEKGVKVADG
jgi:glycosyltransferase involved in cell wall biosynthesis